MDMLNIASLFVAILALIVTVIANIISNYHYVESKAPQLTFGLSENENELYLSIKNTGESAAKDIKININSIENNGDNNKIYNHFKEEFYLFPEEIVQGEIAFSGQNMITQIFPQIYVDVTYKAMNNKKTVKYSRNISFLKGNKQTARDKSFVDIADKLDSIMYSENRIANYVEGRNLYAFDRLNVMAYSSLKQDMMDAMSVNNDNKKRKYKKK